MGRLRIVLDTNALLRCVSKRSSFAYVVNRLYAEEYELYVSNDILLEYEEKIGDLFDEQTATETLTSFDLLENVVPITVDFYLRTIPKDADDNKFVDCAFACNAHYLVTNDKHYNVLKSLPFPSINVITLEEFAELLQASNPTGV